MKININKAGRWLFAFLILFTIGLVTNATELGTLEPHKFYFYPNTDQELSWKVISGELSPGDLDCFNNG